jgi:hypothetical protein
MSALATRIEREAGRPLTPIEIFNISASRETTLSRLLTLYICTGLAFMLLPGTFLGVWNLIAISSRQSTQTVSSAWIQAHGHAQIFGWIGTFILGIGFYSIPKLRRLNSFALSAVYTAWGLWTTGVTTRWICTVYNWHWRTLFTVISNCQKDVLSVGVQMYIDRFAARMAKHVGQTLLKHAKQCEFGGLGQGRNSGHFEVRVNAAAFRRFIDIPSRGRCEANFIQ